MTARCAAGSASSSPTSTASPGQHIPKNGDEYAYEHVTRLTAGSGALLPLRSDIPVLRNTKPPLLFWQGIASTNGGRNKRRGPSWGRLIVKVLEHLGLTSPEAEKPPPPVREVLRVAEQGDGWGVPADWE